MGPRRSQTTNLLFIVGGAGGIAIAILRLNNHIQYLPNDVRSQPWFDPAFSAFMAAWSLAFLVVGVVRFIRTARSRTR